MRRTLIATLLTSAIAISCSAPEKGATTDTAGTARIVDSAGGETADSAHDMAGMDHSKMPGMAKADSVSSSAPASTMAGMDHSNMPGMSKAPPATGRPSQPGSMAGMDHSKMPGMDKPPTSPRTPASAMAGMDHSNMAGMDHSNMAGMTRTQTPSRTAANAMAAMDHSNMPGMTRAPANTAGAPAAAPTEFGASPVDDKLRQIVATLIRDSLVQRRIAADSSLRRAWKNPAVRQLILKTPDGM